jgi:hypothetical protein
MGWIAVLVSKCRDLTEAQLNTRNKVVGWGWESHENGKSDPASHQLSEWMNGSAM